MKEYPIIFSRDHPRKILDGIKTMTRRTGGLNEVNREPDAWCISGNVGAEWGFGNLHCEDDIIIRCPYGQVGDRLRVRETHYRYGRWQKNGWTKRGKPAWTFVATTGQVRYSDNPPEKQWVGWTREQLASKAHSDWYKRPSIFLPKKYIRIMLEITELRAEKLRSISSADALAEGGYSIDEFIEMYLKLSRLPENADPLNWVIGFKVIPNAR